MAREKKNLSSLKEKNEEQVAKISSPTKKLRPFLEMRAEIQLGNDRVIESEDLRD